MKYKFDRFDMMKLGLFFETESEFDLFIDVITEEYEISIGEAIAAYVDADTLELFNDDESGDEVEKWALENPEECGRILSSCKEKLSNELMQYKDEIPGIKKVNMEKYRNIEIDNYDLDLSIRTHNVLKRNHIKNVGMIFEYAELTDIPKLGRRCAEELLLKLYEIAFCIPQ